jgi:digeranylgeranylglycerophospholipid reductase
LPLFGLKRLMRFGPDLALPNMLVDAAIATTPMRGLAAHVYFHRRSARGISFAEFEARIAASAGDGPRPVRSATM